MWTIFIRVATLSLSLSLSCYYFLYCNIFCRWAKTRLFLSIVILVYFSYYLCSLHHLTLPQKRINVCLCTVKYVHVSYSIYSFYSCIGTTKKISIKIFLLRCALASALQSRWKLKLNQEIWSVCAVEKLDTDEIPKRMKKTITTTRTQHKTIRGQWFYSMPESTACV